MSDPLADRELDLLALANWDVPIVLTADVAGGFPGLMPAQLEVVTRVAAAAQGCVDAIRRSDVVGMARFGGGVNRRDHVDESKLLTLRIRRIHGTEALPEVTDLLITNLVEGMARRVEVVDGAVRPRTYRLRPIEDGCFAAVDTGRAPSRTHVFVGVGTDRYELTRAVLSRADRERLALDTAALARLVVLVDPSTGTPVQLRSGSDVEVTVAGITIWIANDGALKRERDFTSYLRASLSNAAQATRHSPRRAPVGVEVAGDPVADAAIARSGTEEVADLPRLVARHAAELSARLDARVRERALAIVLTAVNTWPELRTLDGLRAMADQLFRPTATPHHRVNDPRDAILRSAFGTVDRELRYRYFGPHGHATALLDLVIERLNGNGERRRR